MSSTANGFDVLRSEYSIFLISSFKGNTIEILKSTFDDNQASDADKRAALDQVFRDVLLNFIKEKDIQKLGNFITFSIDSCRMQMTGPTMPVVLLGDIFDALTLDDCEKMFTYVEDNVNIWKEEIFFIACKNNLLRMCNDLLRRLSRSQNTVFCGRILLFLAKFFPFSERSGLNIVSEFNLENITELSNKDNDSLCDTLEIDKDDKKVPIDYNLYCKFWSLQDFFRNPNQCYNKVQWKMFTSHTTNVLSAFSSFKLEAIQTKSNHKYNATVGENDMEADRVQGETHYFAKYLTNQKLLELQLSDSNFRRYVLVQFLIMFQYLNSTVKFKSEGQTLSSSQGDWVKDTWNLVINLLSDTPPDGKEFAKSVIHIMNREEQWNAWKNDGCPEFKKPNPLPSEADDEKKGKTPEKGQGRTKRAKRLLGDIIKECTEHGKYYMGTEELTKLWNLGPDNLQACKGKDRDFLPSLEYLENPSNRENDSSYEWRALRLLARRSPHFFTNSNSPINRLPDYLENMVKKVARDSKESKQESPEGQQPMDESENYTEQIDNDFLKTENDAQLMDTQTDKAVSRKPKSVTPAQIDIISEKIAKDWKKLATKIGYKEDEIEFFETENKTPVLQAKKMLTLWFEDDVDANLDNLSYTLEGLEMLEGFEVIKTFE